MASPGSRLLYFFSDSKNTPVFLLNESDVTNLAIAGFV